MSWRILGCMLGSSSDFGDCMNLRPSEAGVRHAGFRDVGRLADAWAICCAYRPLSSCFLGLPYRILNINHKKELLRTFRK